MGQLYLQPPLGTASSHKATRLFCQATQQLYHPFANNVSLIQYLLSQYFDLLVVARASVPVGFHLCLCESYFLLGSLALRLTVLSNWSPIAIFNNSLFTCKFLQHIMLLLYVSVELLVLWLLCLNDCVHRLLLIVCTHGLDMLRLLLELLNLPSGYFGGLLLQ